MPFSDLKAAVIDAQLCTVCGLCEAVCPGDLISVKSLIPTLHAETDATKCGSCRLCLDICPGRDPATPDTESELFGRSRSVEERWLGILDRVYGGRASDPAIVAASASGGSATVLLQAALHEFRLDAVLVMGRDPDSPWRAAPALCENESDLRSYAQATYQLAPHLSSLADLLQNPMNDRRVGVIGLACHIQAIRKLQRHSSPEGDRCRTRIPVLIEIACSSSTLPSGTETFIEQELDVSLTDVASVHYRDNGYPGEFAVTTKTGERRAVPVWQAIRHFKGFKTHRCLSCGDWLSGLADVSICDGDPNIFISSCLDAGREKFGTILVRTPAGARLVEAARAAGRLELWPADISTDLHLGLLRKRNRRAHYEQKCESLPAGPIPGYIEESVPVDDERFVHPPTAPKA